MNNIYFHIPDLLQEYSAIVLATVTGTTGSTPQKPGSSALFNRNGLVIGTVGGGVLEAEVQEIAQRALRTGESGYYRFRLDGDISRGDNAICGGEAGILLDASPGDHSAVFGSVLKSLNAGIAGVLVTTMTTASGQQISIRRRWVTKEENADTLFDESPESTEVLQQMLETVKPGDFREFSLAPSGMNHEVRIFLESICPPPRLVIAGAGHIGKALSHIGKLLDFEVTVVDDRPEYASAANLPDADHIVVRDIGQAMEELRKTPDTFVVIVTRGHKDDARALKACIGSGVAYLGMIGSKKKIALMKKDFLERGWSAPADWDSIHAPIGLDIQSVTVQEIAISIAAQLIMVKNSKNTEHG